MALLRHCNFAKQVQEEWKQGHEDENPYYGWAGKNLYEQPPEYTPLGLNPLFEGPGMNGKGGMHRLQTILSLLLFSHQ